ncbi:nitrogen fixation negative regulator NifL [Pseudothauera nasutitermitis]|uniref:histidine kinase n=1 Tax=Pseudothauera nasutitermitis TaxID=2565930 RepID=A0A4S4AY68_9RHOO|nr:nitrogen fixation negative regulator NifL [Pseudothauera nasutitermitis]THF64596.1 nitrogen fixation negative regulator NifL [Pseudothauera nasutitermitis]
MATPAPSAAPVSRAIPEHITDALFHHAVDQSAIAISITDARATVLYVNRAFCAITGYAAEEVVGRNQSLLSYKSTPKTVYQELWQALTDGRSWTGRLLNRRKDGSPYVAELTVTPLSAQGEGEPHYLGMHWDATDEHRLSQQLTNHKQLIESVISVAPVAVALLNSDGRVVLDNPAYRRIASELGGGEPAHAVMGALQHSLGEAFHHAVTHRRALSGHELRFERPGGEARWYACSLAWFEERSTLPDAFYGDDRSDYQLLVMHDISASKRQEEALRLAAMRAMLSEGEFNQSLRETLAGAVFQLQRPVNLIAAAAALQKRRCGPGAVCDPLARVLADAQAAGEQAIATLQAAMPPEPHEPAGPVNLNEVLRDVLMLETDALLSAGVTVDWHPAHVLPSVQGDPAALRNLFRQLIGNAIEAMNVRGWRERALFLRTAAHGGQVEAEIVDTGPGIPEALRLKIFEPFFSTKPSRGGARGVGLALAQEIVSRHRGVLEIDPRHTGGCRLLVSFPASRGGAAAPEGHG